MGASAERRSEHFTQRCCQRAPIIGLHQLHSSSSFRLCCVVVVVLFLSSSSPRAESIVLQASPTAPEPRSTVLLNPDERSSWLKCLAGKEEGLRLRGGGEGERMLLVKTLKGDSFQVDVAGLESVAELKRKIAETRGFSTEESDLRDSKAGMKIIHQGKVLADTVALSTFFKAGGFVVLMPPKKPKTQPSVTSTPAAVTDSQTHTSTPPTPAQPTTPLPPSAPEGQEGGGTEGRSGRENPHAETLATGAELESAVQSLCGMGFTEAEVRRALRAGFNNPDRAADILFNGMPGADPAPAPPSSSPSSSAPAAAAAPSSGSAGAAAPVMMSAGAGAAATQGAAAAGGREGPGPGEAQVAGRESGGGGEGGEAGPLDFLRQLPHFTIMRQSIQMQPHLLPQLLQQLGRTNPQLLALINLHQAEFVRLVNEPVGEEELQQSVQQAQQAEGGAAQGNYNTIQVSEEEMQQIERLEQLVFPMGLNRRVVLESWLACDRDEQLAANYMLNNLEDLRNQLPE